MTAPLAPSAPAASPASAAGRVRVGVDIGGSKVAVLVVAGDHDVLAQRRIPMHVFDPDAAVARIAGVVLEALASAGAATADVEAVGVGVPGRIDPSTGRVRFAVNLGWHDLPLRDRLEAALGVPCVVENDVRAAAAGIHHRSLFGPIDDLAYLSIGTGVSAGVVLRGRLHRGVRGLAGEIGHLVIDPAGPACVCGLTGCLEAVASGPSIARAACELIAAGADSTLATVVDPTAVEVFAAAGAGDAVARRVIEQAGDAVARGVHALSVAYDVELVVLGGGVSRAGSPFVAVVEAALDQMRAASPFAGEVLDGVAVRLLPADAEAGAWGALTLTQSTAAVGADRATAGELGRGAELPGGASPGRR